MSRRGWNKLGAVARARTEHEKTAQIRRLAAGIRDQDQLDKILADADPALRNDVLATLTPYLKFTPIPDSDPIGDCPRCGLRRGAIIAHECAGLP